MEGLGKLTAKLGSMHNGKKVSKKVIISIPVTGRGGL
jgi:hypothetical protein